MNQDYCAEPMLKLEDALLRIQSIIKPIQSSELKSIRHALGRILAEDIEARIDFPPFANAAMDGYALNGIDSIKSFKQVGRSYTGRPYLDELKLGECVRISTGAVIPKGAQAVVMQEHITLNNGFIEPIRSINLAENIRSQGEEIQMGEKILSKGKKISAADMGLLAANGFSDISVLRKARVAFFSTGDELQSIGNGLKMGEIYDSNRYTLYGLLEPCGVEVLDLGVIKDDKQALKSALKEAASLADVIITTGGASVSEVDFIATVLSEIGKIEFWKIAMKPGKPVAFGIIDRSLFFGLPGNPVSVMVTFEKILRPALQLLMGVTSVPSLRLQAISKSRLFKSPGRLEFQRGFFSQEGDSISVTGFVHQGPHLLLSMSKANCFIVLPPENEGVQPGELVYIEPF